MVLVSWLLDTKISMPDFTADDDEGIWRKQEVDEEEVEENRLVIY